MTRPLVLCFFASLALASRAQAQDTTLRRVSHEGVSAAFFAQPPVQEMNYSGAHYAVQRWNEIVLRVMQAPTGTMSPLEAGRGRASTSATRVCGVSAERVVIEQPEEHLRAYESPARTPDGELEGGPVVHRDITHPATTLVQLSFEWRGTEVRVSWLVETAQRAAQRAHERRFLRSLRCER